MTTVLEELSEDLADVSAGVLRSLVQVRNGERGAGAGAIWHTDGLIVTNAHVVSERKPPHGPRHTQAGQLSVVLPDGRELPARVLALDEEHDLAALRVDAHDLPTVQLGDSRKLQPGDMVVGDRGFADRMYGPVGIAPGMEFHPPFMCFLNHKLQWIIIGNRR